LPTILIVFSTVVGGSVDGICGILQPFHRKGRKIVWDKPMKEFFGFESAFFGNVWGEIAAEEEPTFN